MIFASNRCWPSIAPWCRRIGILGWVVGILGISGVSRAAPTVGADQLAREVDLWLDYVAALNRPVLVEAAGSHGSIGTSIGMGTSRTTASGDMGHIAGAEMNGTLEGGAETSLARAWFIQGTPWPVDFAASVGAAPDASMTTISGHIQWTAFEGLGLPAVTARAGYARMEGLRTTKIESASAEGVIGMGLLRYFDIYATIGVVRHVASFDANQAAGGETSGLSLLFNEIEPTVVHRDRTWLAPVRRAGLRISPMPLVNVTVEAGYAGSGANEVAAKLSVGM